MLSCFVCSFVGNTVDYFLLFTCFFPRERSSWLFCAPGIGASTYTPAVTFLYVFFPGFGSSAASCTTKRHKSQYSMHYVRTYTGTSSFQQRGHPATHLPTDGRVALFDVLARKTDHKNAYIGLRFGGDGAMRPHGDHFSEHYGFCLSRYS